MKLPEVLGLLLVITVARFTFLPLLHAYPQTLSNDVQKSERTKRYTIFDDVRNFGAAMARHGEAVIANANTRFNAKDYFLVKDVERLCRKLIGHTTTYDIVCLENFGNSIFLTSVALLLDNFASETGLYGHGTPTTTTQKPWPIVDIDIIFVAPPTPPPVPTSTSKPFDWPGFILKLLNAITQSFADFGKNIQTEINDLKNLYNTSNSELIKTIEGIKNIGLSLTNVSAEMEEIVNSIDDVNDAIDDAVKTIDESLEQQLISIQESIDNETELIRSSLENGTRFIGTVDVAEDLKNSINNGLAIIEDAIQNMSLILDKSLSDNGNVPKNESYFTISEMLKEIIEILKTARDQEANELEDTSNDLSTTKKYKKSIKPSMYNGLGPIEKPFDSDLKLMINVIESGVESLKDDIQNGTTSLEKAIDKVSFILNEILEILYTTPSEVFEKLDKEMPLKLDSFSLQSAILQNVQELLENIRSNQTEKLASNRDELSLRVAKLGDGIAANNKWKSAGQRIKEISEDIGKIDIDANNAVQSFAVQLEKLGTTLHDIGEMVPEIKAGCLLKNVGTLIRVCFENNLKSRFDEEYKTG